MSDNGYLYIQVQDALLDGDDARVQGFTWNMQALGTRYRLSYADVLVCGEEGQVSEDEAIVVLVKLGYRVEPPRLKNEHVCLDCGNPFRANAHAKYCSSLCRKRASLKRLGGRGEKVSR